jgi:hypothetical protein
MNTRSAILYGFAWVLAAGCVPAQAPAAAGKAAADAALREIDDPHSGARWLLSKDAEHPGGPGRLVQLGKDEQAGSAGKRPRPAPAAPVIRAGDRIVVEEHTDVVDAAFEAVALGPAVERRRLHARLKIGGRVVRVIALGPGRARLATAEEARP